MGGAACAWLVLLLVGVGCAASGAGAAGSAVDEPAPTDLPRPTARPATPAPTPSTGPHAGIVDVVEVIQAPSNETGQRLVAMQLRGAAGTSAIFRSVEIRAWAVSIDGSRCDEPPVPTVLHPEHDEAVRPMLADQTRTAIVRSLGPARAAAGSMLVARFRYGPVPSLNGDFDGWVSFHVPAASAHGFCAFDVHGVVVVVAGETTTAELPTLRIDTRDADG